LPGGAQLNLVQGSRSPAVISVALQLPETEGNKRLTDKFPSTTSLWSILRVFETQQKLNFTQRGVPNVTTGAGRLFYETPQLVVLNRELVGFGDLQKTLSQIGVNSGNVLIRLIFKITEQPLEDAMLEISQYFKDTADPAPSATGQTAPGKPADAPDTASKPPTSETNPSPAPAPQPAPAEAVTQTPSTNPSPPNPPTPASGLTVYLPGPSPTPAAAAQPFEPADYVPTVEHAATHQARLQRDARNRRLPSERELEAARAERRASRAAVNAVRVRVRLPDGALLERAFARGEGGGSSAGPAAADVYALVRGCLRRPDAPFELRYFPDADAGSAAATAMRTLPDSPALALLDDGGDGDVKAGAKTALGWRGNVLVSLAWLAGADKDAVGGALLRDDVRKDARALRVEAPSEDKMDVDKDEGKEKGLLGLFKKDAQGKSGVDKEARLKNFLFGKKK
jgi:tether containing UBX domain for GLUT4